MKKYFSLLAVLIISLATIGCEPDDEKDQINISPSGIIVSTIPFDQIKSNSKVLKEIEKLTKKRNGKMQYDSTGFYYNETNVLKIAYSDYTTYTFQIHREAESRYLENLVIRENTSGGIDSYIVSYNLTDEERINLKNGDRIKNFLNTVNIKTTNSNSNTRTYYKRADGTCFYTSEYDENGDHCDWDPGCYFEVNVDVCPQGYIDLSFVAVDHPGTGDSGTPGGFPISTIIGTPTGPISPVSGPSIPGGGSGGGYNPVPFPADPVITAPLINFVLEDFKDGLDNDQRLFLKQNITIKMGIYSLIGIESEGLESRQELANKIIEFAMEDEENIEIAEQILNYLDEKDNSEESLNISDEILDAINEYKQEFSDPDEDLIEAFVNEVLNPGELDEIEEEDLGPSCESFNFVSTGGETDWQEAAVENIHFNVVLISPQGINVSQPINYTQPILFGCPTILTVGNTVISPGTAATVTAQALRRSMDETVNKFGNKPVTETMVRIFFESRLKRNCNMSLPGSRVNFNANNFNVTPTQYQTELFGTGDCD